jgi:CHAT domain-containing protein
LTALEVADLDFSSARLVVLSACDTGLASGQSGDGVLGMQRAFQLAGARTCVAALWKVDDDATRTLMDHFYRGLWVEGASPLEAMRQAQLTLLREYRYDPSKLTLVRGKGGERPLQGAKEPRSPKLPPAYWAAFTLSGDWRGR